MTADEIADKVVAHLNTLTGASIAFQAAKPADTAEAQKETDTFRVFVLPFSESETPFDNANSCRRERVVSIVVNGPLAGTIDRAKALKFSEFVRTSLEDVNFDRYLWAGNETVSLYDADALKTKNQFLSLARATYYDLA